MKTALLTILFCIFGFVAINAQTKDTFFDSKGVKIHYSVEGKGTPVILVHGWASNGAQNWSAVVKDLSKDFQVVTFDCRGHGKSGKPIEAKDYGVEMVNDIVRLMDFLKIKKAHLAGYSMGAMIVLKFVAAHPNRVLSAIMAGQGGVREDTLKNSDEPVLKYLDKGMNVAEALIASSEPKPTNAEQALMKFAFAGNDSKALAATMRGFKELLVTNTQLKKIKTPVLAMYSNDAENVKPLKNLLKTVEMVEIKDANHTTAPYKTEFVGAIRNFLKKLS